MLLLFASFAGCFCIVYAVLGMGYRITKEVGFFLVELFFCVFFYSLHKSLCSAFFLNFFFLLQRLCR